MNDFRGTSITESLARRPECTFGTPVDLSGETSWWLPVIDLVTFMNAADLQSDLARAFRLAREASLCRHGSQAELLQHAQYHMHMFKIGGNLLRLNYDLPERDWKALLNFPTLLSLISFSHKVSGILADACATHWPFLTNSELETTDFPLLN